jgi:transposase
LTDATSAEAVAEIGGVRQKVHFFCLDLPQSDACFVKAYPRETTEAFLDGHVAAFAFFGGVPRSILYDNLKLAVARICGDGRRERTRAFTGLVSHYLFQDRFGRPGKGNDKGKVEGLVKFARANFLTPLPVAASYEALNAMLAERCRLRQADRAGRHAETIGARLAADLVALQRLRQTHLAGDKLFVDFAGQTLAVVDPATGEVWPAQVFVAVLGASSLTYAEVRWSQGLADWVG